VELNGVEMREVEVGEVPGWVGSLHESRVNVGHGEAEGPEFSSGAQKFHLFSTKALLFLNIYIPIKACLYVRHVLM
jgi:hypothetical protein